MKNFISFNRALSPTRWHYHLKNKLLNFLTAIFSNEKKALALTGSGAATLFMADYHPLRMELLGTITIS